MAAKNGGIFSNLSDEGRRHDEGLGAVGPVARQDPRDTVTRRADLGNWMGRNGRSKNAANLR